jgi:hypothetical protein
MFDDAVFRWILLAVIAVGVAILLWWQDFDGMRSAWEYHRRIRTRERLTGDEFYRRFYAGSGMPADLIVAVRDFHASHWGENPELLRPEDDLFAVNAGLDCAEWVREAKARFGVTLSEGATVDLRAALPKKEATFDTVLLCIHALRNQPKQAEPSRCT